MPALFITVFHFTAKSVCKDDVRNGYLWICGSKVTPGRRMSFLCRRSAVGSIDLTQCDCSNCAWVNSSPGAVLCFNQEGSGFEDFDSDTEMIRVSDELNNVTLHFCVGTEICSFLIRGLQGLLAPRDHQDTQEMLWRTSSLDHLGPQGKMGRRANLGCLYVSQAYILKYPQIHLRSFF